MLRPLKMIFAAALLLLLVGPAFAQSVDTAWVRRFNGAGNGGDEPGGMVVDDSGYVYVTGSLCTAASADDYGTIKYDPDGDTVWVRTYNGSGNDYDFAAGVAVDNSGNVYISGMSAVSATLYDYVTIKYHSNGDTAWLRRYDGPSSGSDMATAVKVDGSGNVYVAGYSDSTGTGKDYVTVKYQSNGDFAWVRRYNGPGNADEYAAAMAMDSAGNVYVTGYSGGSGTASDYATIKYLPNGDTAWVRRYNHLANHNDRPGGIVVDGDGNVYVTGVSRGTDSYDDYATIKYRPNGDTAWVRRYNGPADSTDMAGGIVVDGSGNVYVTGLSVGVGSSLEDYATVKYDSSGTELWVKRFNCAGGTDDPQAIALDGSDDIYVTGRSGCGGATGYDYVTIKYHPDGVTAWLRKYQGPVANGKDEAFFLSLDNSGNVYVTGRSRGSEGASDYDYATIKYVPVTHAVSIIDNAFVPQHDTIIAGESVRWTNNGAVQHTSTSDGKSMWDSGTLDPGESFTFRFDTPGSYPYHCEFHPSMTGTILVQSSSDVWDETESRERPSEFELSQNYPNPFNPSTTIHYTVHRPQSAIRSPIPTTLKIYNILGEKVRTLVDEPKWAGNYTVQWEGKNDKGEQLASGVYFYQLKVGDYISAKKMVLLK